MRIKTSFHNDWHGRQVESPHHQPCVAKNEITSQSKVYPQTKDITPNNVGTKPQTEDITPNNVGTKPQTEDITPNNVGTKPQTEDVTTQQRWDIILQL